MLSHEEVENVLKEDPWLAVKLSNERELQERYPHRKTLHNVFEGKVLLMAGSCTGQLMVIDQELGGAVICNVQAHETRVILIACNPKADQVISVGEGITHCCAAIVTILSFADNAIKVWRVYPNVEYDILSPQMMFVARCTPSHLIAIKHRLCVTTNQPNVTAYNVTLYNLATNGVCLCMRVVQCVCFVCLCKCLYMNMHVCVCMHVFGMKAHMYICMYYWEIFEVK